MANIRLQVNGTDRSLDAQPEMPLLWALRDLLGLTGTKFGCGLAQCGACTVLVDGVAAFSCVTPVSSVGDRAITTIEGLPSDGSHPIQQAWLAEAVSQCGYCQPGHILTAVALLGQHPNPTDADIDTAFRDHLCRCGTYLRIRRAVHRAASGG
jgi:aerobic-type carbon monoxide dehydrogenase small subunit (CoxS/CutS family)